MPRGPAIKPVSTVGTAKAPRSLALRLKLTRAPRGHSTRKRLRHQPSQRRLSTSGGPCPTGSAHPLARPAAGNGSVTQPIDAGPWAHRGTGSRPYPSVVPTMPTDALVATQVTQPQAEPVRRCNGGDRAHPDHAPLEKSTIGPKHRPAWRPQWARAEALNLVVHPTRRTSRCSPVQSTRCERSPSSGSTCGSIHRVRQRLRR